MSLWSPRGVAWIGGLLIAAIVALASYDIYRGYQAAVDNTGRELDTQARMIAEQTARSFQAVDVHLRQLEQQHRQGTLMRFKREELRTILQEQAVGLVQAEGLVLIGPSGEVQASSYLPPAVEEAVNVSKQETFVVLRDDRRQGFYIGDALPGANDNRFMFPMARRVEKPDGAFAGIVAARGKIDYFQEFYRDLRVGEGTTINLMKQNGTLLARHPPAEEALGKSFPFFFDVVAKHRIGGGRPIRIISPLDGAERFVALQAVPGYPLTVALARDTGTSLAAWRQQAFGTAGRTLALSALAALLLFLLSRQLRRLERTHQELTASRERFELAVAGSDDGIWVYDFVAKRVFASARAREISAMPPGPEMQPMEEWFGAVPIHPDDAARRKAAMEAHLAGETPAYEGEFRMLLPGGGYRWIRIHGLCVRDPKGRPLLMAGSTSDVDARKRAEEALRESEERHRAIFAGTTDELILRDSKGRIVDVNSAFLEVNGLTREQVMADPERIFAPDELHPKLRELYARARAGETVRYEADVERRNGRRASLEVRIVPVMHRGEAHSLSLARDITAQKLAEKALRLSEEQYRAIFNAAADAFVLRDEQARIVDVNPSFLEMSGYTREEVIEAKRWLFALPETLEKAAEMHRRVVSGESVRFEMQARRKDGVLIDVEMRAVPIIYQGQPHALGMARDITAQKRAEAERARLEGQLLQAKKLEAIGTLAGGIAHDFNNILAAILGYGEMAQKQAAAGTPLRRHLDQVVNAGMRAKSLVERILAFSRSGIGARQPVHVQSAVSEALDLAAASFSGKLILKRRLRAGDAAVMGDPTQIHQVVMNLCANAAQAMKSSGTLTVSLDVVEKGDMQAATSTLAAGRYVRLKVKDTGEGIAPQVLERIFDPFFTTKEVGVGTGLGLSLVHGIVTDLGGGIDVESRVGEGTTFKVFLPWSSATAAAAGEEVEAPAGAGETILLVDDEESLVRLGEEVIAGLGYEPVGFTSSAAALAAFRAAPERFDAVLSDESMPEVTGSELAREIRRIRPDARIVLMTGFVTPALAAKAREIGVIEVLAKPLVARDVARSLASALRRG